MHAHNVAELVFYGLVTVVLFTCVALVFGSVVIDVIHDRSRRATSGRNAGVRLRSIKTPQVRARLVAHRAIIHASNEQAIALSNRYTNKRTRTAEEAERWKAEYNELLGVRRPRKEAVDARLVAANITTEVYFNKGYITLNYPRSK